LHALGLDAVTVPESVVYHLQYSKVSNVRSAIRKAYLSTRNRILAYYKNSSAKSFIKMLPLLVVGSFAKLTELPFTALQKAVYMVAMLPITFAAFIGATVHCQRYTAYRSHLATARESVGV
jgi:hypothetical protein